MRTPLLVLAMVALLAGCGSESQSGGGGTAAAGEVRLKVTAGPTCPVETEPPTPGCEPRAVERAVVKLDGPTHVRIVVRDGAATVNLPVGMYQVVPMPVAGLMGAPSPTTVKVVAGSSTPLRLSYDTGIR